MPLGIHIRIADLDRVKKPEFRHGMIILETLANFDLFVRLIKVDNLSENYPMRKN